MPQFPQQSDRPRQSFPANTGEPWFLKKVANAWWVTHLAYRTKQFYAHRALRAFKAITTLPQPSAFQALGGPAWGHFSRARPSLPE